jgi:SET domain
MPIVIDLTEEDVWVDCEDYWDDCEDYSVFVEGISHVLRRRKCDIDNCNRTTQLDLCSQHLLEKGLVVKESGLSDAGWGLFSTIDREAGDRIAYFTGTKLHQSEVVGRHRYVVWAGNGSVIDCSIERCAAACVNSCSGKNNCNLIVFGKRSYIRTTKRIHKGEELYIPYGQRYRI